MARREIINRQCFHCKEVVIISREAYYSIAFDPNKEQKIRGKQMLVRFFHVNCFFEIAGKDYMFDETEIDKIK